MSSRLDNLRDMFEIEDDSYTNVEADNCPSRKFNLEADILGTETLLSQYRKEYSRLKNSEGNEDALFWLREYISYCEEDLEYLNKQLEN